MKSYSLEELAKHHERTGSVACRYVVESAYQALELQNAELVAHSSLLKQQFGLALDMLEKYLLRDDHLTGDDASDFAEFQHYLESAPTQHLRDIQAEAGRAGYAAALEANSIDLGITDRPDMIALLAERYAEKVRRGEV